MMKRKVIHKVLIASLALAPLAPLAGCEQLPGDKKTQGAVIGGLGGAVAGAAIGKNNRVLGALIGGALGAGGGYLIGSQLSKSAPEHRDDAIHASQDAERNPARPEDVRRARTADLNNDGYVTMDEVVAMQRAGLSDNEMIDRLRATNQFFELTPEQERYLADRNVDNRVITAMRTMNQDQRERALQRYPSNQNDSQYDRDNNNRYDRDNRDNYDRTNYHRDSETPVGEPNV